MKDIFNIDFSLESLNEYKNEINEINNICKKLDNDRPFQRKYKRYLKSKKRKETKK